MIDSQLLATLLSVATGAIISFGISYFGIYRNETFAKLERQKEIVASALLQSSKLFDSFLSYKPHLLYQSRLGLAIEDESKQKIIKAVEIYDEAKYSQYLLPKILQKRWDMMLVLISEFQNLNKADGIIINRSLCDAQNYIIYIKDSLLDFLDGKKVRGELERPYLNRDSMKNWEDDSVKN
jgi:hypothetical protein